MSYSVACCKGCGFIFANKLQEPEIFRQYYSRYSKYDFSTTVSAHDQLRFKAAVDICSGTIGKEAMIADLGCGHGALLSNFKSTGFANLYGLDPAPNAAEHGFKMFGLNNIFRGSMSEAARVLPMERMDLVCIMAVLEHLWEIKSDLNHIFQNLKQGCKILVEVPPLEKFDASESEPFGEFSLEHIQFFSKNSLNHLMHLLGSRPVSHKFVHLPSIKANSLLCLYEYTGHTVADNALFDLTADESLITEYIAVSDAKLSHAISRIRKNKFLIYGAGSHTARLLPRLENIAGCEIAGIVDSNPNLINSFIGSHKIKSPQELSSFPDIPILISSYRSQNEIAQFVRSRHPNELILLY